MQNRRTVRSTVRCLALAGLAALCLTDAALALESEPASPVARSGAGAMAPGSDEAFAVRVARELGYAERARSPDSRAACLKRLRALGAPAVDVFFRALRTGRVPSGGGQATGSLTPRMRAAILEVYPALPRAEVDALLDLLRGSVGRLGADARLAALEVLGSLGRRDTLDLLLALGAPEGGDDAAIAPSARTAFEVALGRLVARDAKVLDAIRGRWKGLSAATRAGVLRALGNAKRSEGLDLLLDVMAFDDTSRPRAVAEAPRLAALAERGERASLTERVRRDLDAFEPESRRVALTAVAHLRDEGAIPALIGLLDSTVPGEAELAHWALHDITGLDLRAESAVWRRWLAREQAWQTHQAPQVREDLASREPERVLAALRKVAKVRLGREEFSALVAGALRNRSVEVRRAACAALASLATEPARTALSGACEDADAGVREAAQKALDRFSATR